MRTLVSHLFIGDLYEYLHSHHIVADFTHNSAGNDLAKLYSSQPGLQPLDMFEREEQQRNLELLLSQERVVSLIYAKTFPIANVSAAVADKHRMAFGTHSANSGAPNLPSGGENQPLLNLLSDSCLERDAQGQPASSQGGNHLSGSSSSSADGKLPAIANR